jgi:hypothetical protein
MIKKSSINFRIEWILIMLFLSSIIGLASAYDSANACSLNVSLINQDPNPAVPGSYVDIVIQVSGVQNSQCKGAQLQLVSSYPFSLDDNSIKTLSGSTYASDSSNVWNIPYSIRVDKDALDGDSEIEVHYNSGDSGKALLDSYQSKKFAIKIKDSRTTFDADIWI